MLLQQQHEISHLQLNLQGQWNSAPARWPV
jgi:hypothetical protein